MPRRDQVDISALSDLCTPWCVQVVATLRIADHMADGLTRIDAKVAELRALLGRIRRQGHSAPRLDR